MTAQDNAATVRALNEAYNKRDWDGAIALTTPEVTFVNVATGQTFHGPEGVRRFLQGWATAFPDSRVETTQVVGASTAHSRVPSAITRIRALRSSSCIAWSTCLSIPNPPPSANGPKPATTTRVTNGSASGACPCTLATER